MINKIKAFFASLLAQNMAQQARQVELLTLFVFVVLFLVVLWLWQFELTVTIAAANGGTAPVKMNIFQLLLRK